MCIRINSTKICPVPHCCLELVFVMDHICTWLCADEKGAESLFPQTGKLSSSQAHQDIYWRCVALFFITSKRFNPHQNHILFTNVHTLPVVDGIKMTQVFASIGVKVVQVPLKYKTPKDYYASFQNQFYEFSILEHIADSSISHQDQYLILDSDCIFLKPAAPLFVAAKPQGFIGFADDVQPHYVINGLSRNNLKTIYEELLQTQLPEAPAYHLGEFFLASLQNIRSFAADFKVLWPQLLRRHNEGRLKFNEEAHTLSFLYYKNGFGPASENNFLKRIWTNPLFYRNVSPSDVNLTIWHLPAEKTFGLHKLFDYFTSRVANYGLDLSHGFYMQVIQQTLGVPQLTAAMRMRYYWLSTYRALHKRCKALLPKVRHVAAFAAR